MVLSSQILKNKKTDRGQFAVLTKHMNMDFT